MLFMNLGKPAPLWPSTYIKSHQTQVTAVNLVYVLKGNIKGGVSVGCIFRQTEHSSNMLKETTPRTGFRGGGGVKYPTQVQQTGPSWAPLCHLTRTCNNNGCHWLLRVHHVPGTVTISMEKLTYSYNNHKICISFIPEMSQQAQISKNTTLI